MSGKQMKGSQSGFTLIELVVVIVILGILAATAVPKFLDMGSDARVAKMNAAAAALKTGSSLAHAAWLSGGAVMPCPGCSPAQTGTAVTLEGQNIPMLYGYPDVGGDAATDTAASGAEAASGIVLAAGGLADYVTKQTAKNTLEISPDPGHPACKIIYTEAAGTASTGTTPASFSTAPSISVNAITTTNC